jgi:hypothetical protein
MSDLINSFMAFIKPEPAPPPGMYHYIAPQEDPLNFRLHLRVEPDGGGILIVNAATILHLNETATEFAYHMVHGLPEEQVIQKITRRYKIAPEEARLDYRDLIARLHSLVETTDLDPVTILEFERQEPFSGDISAPYRLDCALTYRLPEGIPHDLAPIARVTRELSTDEWKTILDKAWLAGIPHVIFTGGEPTLRPDLPELLAHAEKIEQVSGLLTTGLAFSEPAYLNQLLQTGLDHILFLLLPENPQSWQALENVLAADIYAAVHLTLGASLGVPANDLLDRLAGMGVKAVSLSAATSDNLPAQELARAHAAAIGLDLVWNLPVPYSVANPVAEETGHAEQAHAEGRAWMYIEPDGDVLPAQGVNQVLGNALTGSLKDLWKAIR